MDQVSSLQKVLRRTVLMASVFGSRNVVAFAQSQVPPLSKLCQLFLFGQRRGLAGQLRNAKVSAGTARLEVVSVAPAASVDEWAAGIGLGFVVKAR